VILDFPNGTVKLSISTAGSEPRLAADIGAFGFDVEYDQRNRVQNSTFPESKVEEGE